MFFFTVFRLVEVKNVDISIALGLVENDSVYYVKNTNNLMPDSLFKCTSVYETDPFARHKRHRRNQVEDEFINEHAEWSRAKRGRRQAVFIAAE